LSNFFCNASHTFTTVTEASKDCLLAGFLGMTEVAILWVSERFYGGRFMNNDIDGLGRLWFRPALPVHPTISVSLRAKLAATGGFHRSIA
jgi:hypothetical protein